MRAPSTNLAAAAGSQQPTAGNAPITDADIPGEPGAAAAARHALWEMWRGAIGEVQDDGAAARQQRLLEETRSLIRWIVAFSIVPYFPLHHGEKG